MATCIFFTIRYAIVCLRRTDFFAFSKNEKASAYDVALLKDSVALRQGKKQIYGSRIGRDKETNAYYILPLYDPDNIDKRRAEVGLQPLAEYVEQWQIKWDVEQYKKDLPEIEARQNAGAK